MSRKILVIAFLGILSTAAVSFAQDDSRNPPPPPEGQQADRRQGVLRDLGLSREQLDDIRRINRERRQNLSAAQEKLRVANDKLDEAIYADDASEESINMRIAEVQTAHAEMLRVRSMMEFQIRKVLNPDQLRRFKDARARFGNRQGPQMQRPGKRQGEVGPDGPPRRNPGGRRPQD